MADGNESGSSSDGMESLTDYSGPLRAALNYGYFGGPKKFSEAEKSRCDDLMNEFEDMLGGFSNHGGWEIFFCKYQYFSTFLKKIPEIWQVEKLVSRTVVRWGCPKIKVIFCHSSAFDDAEDIVLANSKRRWMRVGHFKII